MLLPWATGIDTSHAGNEHLRPLECVPALLARGVVEVRAERPRRPPGRQRARRRSQRELASGAASGRGRQSGLEAKAPTHTYIPHARCGAMLRAPSIPSPGRAGLYGAIRQSVSASIYICIADLQGVGWVVRHGSLRPGPSLSEPRGARFIPRSSRRVAATSPRVAARSRCGLARTAARPSAGRSPPRWWAWTGHRSRSRIRNSAARLFASGRILRSA